jgi:hypothetical protein
VNVRKYRLGTLSNGSTRISDDLCHASTAADR